MRPTLGVIVALGILAASCAAPISVEECTGVGQALVGSRRTFTVDDSDGDVYLSTFEVVVLGPGHLVDVRHQGLVGEDIVVRTELDGLGIVRTEAHMWRDRGLQARYETRWCEWQVVDAVADADVNGDWEFVFDTTVTSTQNTTCSPEISEERLTIRQNLQNRLAVDGLNNPGDPPWEGDIVASTLTFGGSRAEDEGVATASLEMTITETVRMDVGDRDEFGRFTRIIGSQLATAMEGTEEWSWTRGDEECAGTSVVTATRAADSYPNP